MEKKSKQRAGRNRTIALSEEDVSRLGPKVLLPGDLTETLSFADVLVNGDILSVLGLLPDAFADLAAAGRVDIFSDLRPQDGPAIEGGKGGKEAI